ncbi:Teichoic acid translocation permease TagG [Oceanobacillus arenosus]|uniref:Transport permease protein n=1 Tax=Oceanobacillus arenosus TaxID=1229153 RepID=A0A3D8Q1A8_9BACI|nr:ABC transporter permease [Oceanobacillus arenosus]RDW22220.1 Teichoic acid translocation permease TagG [Oceanobacillus arenosus]
MFNSMRQVIKEQIEHKDLIIRMASFDIKGMYQLHYLGSLWQFLNPVIQIAIYWVVFGLGIRGGSPVITTVGEVPFFLWMLMGLIPWFFINPSMLQGSNSVFQKMNLVSKMNFPVSLLPTIKIVGNSLQFFILMILLCIVLLIYGFYPTMYFIQLLYYLVCLFSFLFAFTLFSSTIATLVRDYQSFLQSMVRMILYLSPVLWDPAGDRVPDWVTNVLQLNPIYYIIEGFRDSFLARQWFFEDPVYLCYFWALTLTLMFIGSKVHLKFRENFMDYL